MFTIYLIISIEYNNFVKCKCMQQVAEGLADPIKYIYS